MPWIAFYVAIAVLGLGVLALLTFRLYRQVRQFARDVGAAGERISAASASLDQANTNIRTTRR
jgi:hypothetical protein